MSRVTMIDGMAQVPVMLNAWEVGYLRGILEARRTQEQDLRPCFPFEKLVNKIKHAEGDVLGFVPSSPGAVDSADVTCSDGSIDASPHVDGEWEQTPKVHQLKVWPEFFEVVLDRTKPFEIWKNDRNFQKGDVLELREWDPKTEQYIGREVSARVTYVTGFEQPEGQVVMGIEVFK